MVKIQINEKYVIESPMGGNHTDYNEQLAKYRNNLITWGCKMGRVSGGSGFIITSELARGVSFDIVDFLTVMSCEDGKVTGYKPTIAVLNENINNPISEGLPNRVYPSIPEYTNEEGVLVPEVPERIKTWNEWLLNLSRDGVYGGYTCNEVEGSTYYGTNGVYKGLQALSGAELMLLHNSEDAVLVDNVPVTEEI